ncbi:MAG: PAS domain-containing protein, partial [Campylobacterales bacterium]
MWATIQAGCVWKGQLHNRAKDGSSYYVQSTIVPIKDDEGRIVEYISLHYDVTPLVEAEKKLQVALEAQSRFFAGISHELRTPLNAIINFVSLIDEDFDEINR